MMDNDDKCLKDVDAFDAYPFMTGYTRLAYRGHHRPTGRRVVIVLVNECVDDKTRQDASHARLQRDVVLTFASPPPYVPEIICESTSGRGGVIVAEYVSLVLTERWSAKYTNNTVPSAHALLPYRNKLQLAKSATELVQVFESFPLATLAPKKNDTTTLFQVKKSPILFADFSRFNFGFNDQFELKVIDLVSLNAVTIPNDKAIQTEVECGTNRDCFDSIVQLMRPTKKHVALIDTVGENATDMHCIRKTETSTQQGVMGRCHGVDQRIHMRAMCVLYIRPLIQFSTEVQKMEPWYDGDLSSFRVDSLVRLSRRIGEGACNRNVDKRWTIQQVLSGIDELHNATLDWEDSMTPHDKLRLQERNDQDLSALFSFSKPHLFPTNSFLQLKERWNKHKHKQDTCCFVGNLKTGLYEHQSFKPHGPPPFYNEFPIVSPMKAIAVFSIAVAFLFHWCRYNKRQTMSPHTCRSEKNRRKHR